MTTFDRTKSAPRSHKTSFAAYLVLAALGSTNAIPAQGSGNESSDVDLKLETITVTAQKRAEDLQKVPISVTALDIDQLEARGASNVADLQFAAPNVSYEATDNFTPNIRIRGIDSAARNLGFESGLGLYVDGVYSGRSFSFTQSLDDVERVEVLRGPQGTLYGKNTTIGAINLITRRPSSTFDGNVTTEWGDFRHQRLSAFVSGPLVDDRLGAKLSAFAGARDGLFDNLNSAGTGADEYRNFREGGLRGELRFTPSDLIDVALRADVSRYRERPLFGGRIVSAFCPVLPPSQCLPALLPPGAFGQTRNRFDVNLDRRNRQERRLSGVSLTAAVDDLIADLDFTSISAVRDARAEMPVLDVDAAPLDVVVVDYHDDLGQFSQEFRLTSDADTRLRYILGAYYFRQDARTDRTLTFGRDANRFLFGGLGLDTVFAPAFPLPVLTSGEIETDASALFVSGEYDLLPRWTLTGGVRYTRESKRLEAQQSGEPLVSIVRTLPPQVAGQILASILPNVAPVEDEIDDDDLSPSLGIEFDLAERELLYGRWTRGFKSGAWSLDFISFGQTLASTPGAPGFNPLLPVRTADLAKLRFDAERIDSYELGFKSEILDNRLRLNAAFYVLDYGNIQVLQFVPGAAAGFVPNNAEARSRGVEIEFAAIPFEGLEVDGGIGYVDAKYTKYLNPVPGISDAAGERLQNPRWTVTLGGQYSHRLEAWGADLITRFDAYARSLRFAAIGDPSSELPGYAVINGRVGLRFDNGFEFSLWIENLFDREYILDQGTSDRIDFVGVRQLFRYPGDPRTVGLRASYRF